MGKDLKGKELGTGIVQRKDGRYYARVRHKGQLITMYGSNFQELRRRINKEKENIDSGEEVYDKYTVSEWFNLWFDSYKAPVVRPQSIEPMKRKVENTFLQYIGTMKLNEVKSIDVQNALNSLLKDGKYAKSSIAEALGRLRDCFASGVNNHYMKTNPCFDIKAPFGSEGEDERRWLTLDEINRFLTGAKDSWWYEMFYVMIYTGLRIGEVGGLKWKDVHWSTEKEKGYIQVTQNLTVGYCKGVKTVSLGKLKTVNSARRIPFIKDVEEMLKKQKAKVDKLKKDLGKRYRADGEYADLVFVSSMGGICSRYVAERAINRIVEDINLTESITAKREEREPNLMERLYPHALRHTFASLCFLAGLEAKTTQKLMGHANYSTTINIYTHLSEQYIDEDIKKFDTLNIPSLELIA